MPKICHNFHKWEWNSMPICLPIWRWNICVCHKRTFPIFCAMLLVAFGAWLVSWFGHLLPVWTWTSIVYLCVEQELYQLPLQFIERIWAKIYNPPNTYLAHLRHLMKSCCFWLRRISLTAFKCICVQGVTPGIKSCTCRLSLSLG